MRGHPEQTGIGTITVDKAELIAILEANREQHEANFERACDLYQQRAEEALTELVGKVRAGERLALFIHDVRVPEKHLRDYDRVVAMLKMHQGTTIELTEAAYAQYVQDEWEWQRSWFANTMAYLGASGPDEE